MGNQLSHRRVHREEAKGLGLDRIGLFPDKLPHSTQHYNEDSGHEDTADDVRNPALSVGCRNFTCIPPRNHEHVEYSREDCCREFASS
jgi:hypothetical protein